VTPLAPLVSLVLAAAPAHSPPQQLALTISGGASMGAYEAGVAWTLVRYARANSPGVNLAGVSGASAGSINALLAASLWCEAPDESSDATVEDNLFRQTWLPVGMEALLPETDASFAPDDALFRAAPLEEVYGGVEHLVFGGGRRYRPGCMVPLGMSVTRTQPGEGEASGLTAAPQRLVVAWRFAVDESGRAHLEASPIGADRDSAPALLQLGPGNDAANTRQLGNAVLASGAVPFVFRPRTLCDCALQCPAEDRVAPSQCPGPTHGELLPELSCAAVAPLGRRVLCRHTYVDGGIFDNVPLGLTIDLVEGHTQRVPLLPTVYFVVDPDIRRFPPAAQGPADGAGVVEPFQLVKTLVATARSASLAQAAALARWQLDTRILLDRTAVLFDDFAGLQEQALAIVGNEPDPTPGGASRDALHGEQRQRLARFLMACTRDPSLHPACAQQLREGTPFPPEAESGIPAPADVLAFAHQLKASLEATDLAVANASREGLPERLARLARLVDAVFLYAADLRLLRGELGRVRPQLGAPELTAFRDDLLAVIARGRLMAKTLHVLLASLAGAIVREEPIPGGEEPLLVEQLVSPVDTPLDAVLARTAAENGRLGQVRALSRRLDLLADRAEELSGAADQLKNGLSGERALVVTRRFVPLAASSLAGFGGFLDPAFREVDFNIGVYEMAIQLAQFRCATRDPYDLSRAPPKLRADAPWELDFRDASSSECLGDELGQLARDLNLSRSEHALALFARAARAQVAALMGSQAAADAVLRRPAWAWLQAAAAAHPPDELELVLDVLMSHPVACRAEAREALCPDDLGYRALFVGLRQAGFHPRGAQLAAAMEDPDGWLAHLERRLVDRVRAGARAGALKIPASVTPLVETGELLLRRDDALSGGPKWMLDTSSVPKVSFNGARGLPEAFTHLIPYRVRFEVTGGGLAFSWFEPSLRLGSAFSLESLVDAVDLYQWHPATSLGLLPTLAGGGVALSAGPRWSVPWRGAPVLPGAEARVAFFQQRLAVSGGLRSLQEGYRDWTVALSVADLNGLAYWLLFAP
jgi:hypothetical protein